MLIGNISFTLCYCLSKRPNCFHGTCSGLGTWRPRCTRGASSGTRHIVLPPFLFLIVLVIALLDGGASPTAPASYMTRASAPVPVPFPQFSPHVPSYRPITPNPCALGQQVTAVLSRLIVSSRLVYSYPGSYLARMLPSGTVYCSLVIDSFTGLISGPYLFAYIRWL